jgi:nucleotide-binding universal stress UspA family protein
MVCKNLFFASAFDDGPADLSSAEFATQLVASPKGRLTAALAAVSAELPGLQVLPMAHAVLDLINEERLGHASAQAATIERIGQLEGFPVETVVVQKSRHALMDHIMPYARLADLCVAPRPTSETGAANALAEALLFNSGRPVMLVPPRYAGDASFRKVTVAWDGSARAARAVGDAASLISNADAVQIVCVAEDLKGVIPGAGLAARISSDRKRVELVDLLPLEGDVGKAIQRQVKEAQSSLLVMGAFAHARLVELVIGGVTKRLLQHSETPLFLSY